MGTESLSAIAAPGINARTPIAPLARFLLVLSLVCAVACLYVWQRTTVTNVESETQALENQAVELQRSNAALMLSVAAWTTPEYIEGKATTLGMVPARQPVYVRAPVKIAPKSIGAAAREDDPLVTKWWNRLSRLAGPGFDLARPGSPLSIGLGVPPKSILVSSQRSK